MFASAQTQASLLQHLGYKNYYCNSIFASIIFATVQTKHYYCNSLDKTYYYCNNLDTISLHQLRHKHYYCNNLDSISLHQPRHRHYYFGRLEIGIICYYKIPNTIITIATVQTKVLLLQQPGCKYYYCNTPQTHALVLQHLTFIYIF